MRNRKTRSEITALLSETYKKYSENNKDRRREFIDGPVLELLCDIRELLERQSENRPIIRRNRKENKNED